MNIDKAIAILQSPESLAIISLDPDLKDAVKLGSEALKLLEQCRENHYDTSFEDLPGETEE